MSIRKEVSLIFNYTFPKGEYLKTFKLLEIEGRITKKHTTEILALLLEKEEERENA